MLETQGSGAATPAQPRKGEFAIISFVRGVARLGCFFVSAAVLVSCGSSDEPGEAAAEAPTAAVLCKRSHIANPGDREEAIAEAFSTTSTKPVRLLLSEPSVRPGAQFDVVVQNRSDHNVLHGYSYELQHRTPQGWEPVVGEWTTFILIGLGVQAGSTGKCVPIHVPSDATAGRYRVVLGDIGLKGEFDVSGRPIPNPAWEQVQELAQRINDPDTSKEEKAQLQDELDEVRDEMKDG